MNMTGVSIPGWIHTIACTVALMAGAYVILGAKGTPLHRQVGRIFSAAMILSRTG